MPNKKRVFVVSLVLFSILALMSFVQGQANYQFTINNDGETEVYALSTDLFSEYITFDENPAYINAKDSKTIALTTNIPCEKAGSYKISLIVYAQNSKKTIKIPFDVVVPSCYGYNVQTGEEIATGTTKAVFKPYKGTYQLCVNEKASIPVLITNKDKAKTFRFKLDDIDFAELSGKKLFLKQNQRGILYILLEPKDEGDFTFNLDIITDNIGKIPIDFNVKECYSAGVYFAADNITLCGCEPYSYDFFVGNEGTKKAEFGLELDGPEWLSLGLNQNFELESGKSISVALNINAPCRESKTYDANIIAYLVNQKDIKAEDSVSITIVEDCYETRIETEETVEIDYSGIALPVRVSGYAAEQIVYSVSLEGPEWVKLDKNNISLEPEGDEKTINLDIKPSENIEEGEYKIKVTLNSEKASYSKDVSVKLKKETAILEDITEWYGSYSKDVWTAIIVILVIIVLLFLVLSAKKIKKIKVSKKRKREIKRKLLKWFLIILVLALFGYLIDMFGQLLWHWIMWYRYYIYTVVLIVLIVYLISRYKNTQKKEKKEPDDSKKIEEKKKAKKSVRQKRKPKKRYLRYFLILFVILILAGIFIYFSVYYSLLHYINEFLLVYYQYIIAGIVLLIILILLLRFSTRKNKKQKRKKAKS